MMTTVLPMVQLQVLNGAMPPLHCVRVETRTRRTDDDGGLAHKYFLHLEQRSGFRIARKTKYTTRTEAAIHYDRRRSRLPLAANRVRGQRHRSDRHAPSRHPVRAQHLLKPIRVPYKTT